MAIILYFICHQKRQMKCDFEKVSTETGATVLRTKHTQMTHSNGASNIHFNCSWCNSRKNGNISCRKWMGYVYVCYTEQCESPFSLEPFVSNQIFAQLIFSVYRDLARATFSTLPTIWLHIFSLSLSLTHILAVSHNLNLSLFSFYFRPLILYSSVSFAILLSRFFIFCYIFCELNVQLATRWVCVLMCATDCNSNVINRWIYARCKFNYIKIFPSVVQFSPGNTFHCIFVWCCYISRLYNRWLLGTHP